MLRPPLLHLRQMNSKVHGFRSAAIGAKKKGEAPEQELGIRGAKRQIGRAL